MKVPQTVADVLKHHVVFELECIARMYLNVMVPRLQREQEVAGFFRFHRGHRFASSALMEPMSEDFVARMERVRSTAMVNHYYWYIFDEDFELTKAGVQYEALDNGRLRCSDPKRAQALADSLSAAKIDALVRKWFKALPHPFPAADRRAGYRYEPFIWQGEFSLTQVLDRPLSGRVFFEEVIRENLDLGRPDRVALIFGKRVTRRTPGWFRTRCLPKG